MKRFSLLFTLFILLGCITAIAQVKTRYFLNQTEIAPESVFFFNQNDIDSIRQFVEKDTSIVFYTHHKEKIYSYHQLLDLHLIDESAGKLQLNLSQATDVGNPEKLVFFADRVSTVSIICTHPEMTKMVFISPTYALWDETTEVGKKLSAISRKVNNIEPHWKL